MSSGNRSVHRTIKKQQIIVYGRKIENKSFYCRQGLPFNCSSGTRRRNSGCRKKDRSNDLTARRKFCHAGQTRCSEIGRASCREKRKTWVDSEMVAAREKQNITME